MSARGIRAALLAVVCISAAVPSAAVAAPVCRHSPQPRVLYSGLGVLESVISDRAGRLYFTADESLMKVARPGAKPSALVEEVESPGGLVFMRRYERTRLVLGYGNSITGGTTGTLNPRAGLLLVNPRTGKTSTLVSGLGMANGIARGPGAIYASNDFGFGIDRFTFGGDLEALTTRWARVVSSNGLVVDTRGRYLYAAQTFQPAAVQRIEIAHPENVEPFFEASGIDIFAGPDGMTRDARDNLFLAANGAGEVWRIDRQGRMCVVAGGLLLPSAVAFGHGADRFSAGNLYAVTFSGDVVELPDAVRARYPASRSPASAS